jgi:hypothetical protein
VETPALNQAASAVARYLERTAKMAIVANLPVAARTESFAPVHLRAVQRARRCVASIVSLKARSAVSRATATKARNVLRTESVPPEARPVEAAVPLVVLREVLVPA